MERRVVAPGFPAFATVAGRTVFKEFVMMLFIRTTP
jgi:hypothetical protein